MKPTKKRVKRGLRRHKAWMLVNKAFDFKTNWYPCFIVELYKTEQQALMNAGGGKQLKVVPVEIRELPRRGK